MAEIIRFQDPLQQMITEQGPVGAGINVAAGALAPVGPGLGAGSSLLSQASILKALQILGVFAVIPNSLKGRVGELGNEFLVAVGDKVGLEFTNADLRLKAQEIAYTDPIIDPKTNQWYFLDPEGLLLDKRMREAGLGENDRKLRRSQLDTMKQKNLELVTLLNTLPPDYRRPGEDPLTAVSRFYKDQDTQQQKIQARIEQIQGQGAGFTQDPSLPPAQQTQNALSDPAIRLLKSQQGSTNLPSSINEANVSVDNPLSPDRAQANKFANTGPGSGRAAQYSANLRDAQTVVPGSALHDLLSARGAPATTPTDPLLLAAAGQTTFPLPTISNLPPPTPDELLQEEAARRRAKGEKIF